MKTKYYSLDKILKFNAAYNMIIGERSNGKTYAVQKYALERFVKYGEQFAVVRRWQDDFTGKRGATMFNAIVENGEIERMTKGEWTGVYYYASRWYLCKYDENGARITQENPFAYGFAITSQEHDKSTSYPRIKTVLFDEFLSRQSYLPDEFVMFCNVLSTIIRDRNDVRIFMLGNTVNKYCPYFKEMGLKHIDQMKQGAIDVYRYGDNQLTVAVEYCEPNGKRGKASDFYFAFDNPKLKMITGGEWELDIYPHCPCKYRPCDIRYIFFILFERNILQCEVVMKSGGYFLFIHEKTTPLKDTDNDLIFCNEMFKIIETPDGKQTPLKSHRRNIRVSISNPEDKIGEKIFLLFKNHRVFYSNNEVGEMVANYLKL